MKKFKKILTLVFLAVGCALMFCSCSCSNKTPENPDEGPVEPSTGTEIPDTYLVEVSINGVGGSFSSSTGGDTHTENTSPVYTFTPDTGYAVHTILLDGATYYSYLVSENAGPIQVTIPNIDSNHSIEASFYQLDFFVKCTIIDSEPAIHDGGTITSNNQDASDWHKGGTSTEYTIKPKTGYCVYNLKVDGEDRFTYLENPSQATESFTVDFGNINANHAIQVAFYQLCELSDSLFTSFYTASGATEVTKEDKSLNSVNMALSSGEEIFPCGTAQSIKLDVNKNFILTAFDITLDGESYTENILASQNYSCSDFSYNATTKEISFSKLTSKVHIKVYSRPKNVTLVVYNYDTKDKTTLTNYTLYSTYSHAITNYHWYYTESEAIDQTNTYATLSSGDGVLTTGGGSTFIYLDASKLDNNEDYKIVLIYSASELK